MRDVEPAAFIVAFAEHLKKSGTFKVPEWADYIKTAPRKELAPYDPDWYFVRAASIARKLYLRQGLGVGMLSRVYGGGRRNGTRPKHFQRSSRGLLRHILHQLEANNIIERIEENGGRRITPTGRKDADRIAHSIVSRA